MAYGKSMLKGQAYVGWLHLVLCPSPWPHLLPLSNHPPTCLTGLGPFPQDPSPANRLRPQPLPHQLPLGPNKTFVLLKLALSPRYLTSASVQVGDWARASSNKGSFAFTSDSAPWRDLGITNSGHNTHDMSINLFSIPASSGSLITFFCHVRSMREHEASWGQNTS